MFIFGWLMKKKAGSIFVKRGERDIDSFKAVHACAQGGGEKLIVFPEDACTEMSS